MKPDNTSMKDRDQGLQPRVYPCALITGASRGIGAAFARILAQRGYSLGLVARTASDLLVLQAECLALGAPQVEILICDLSQTQAPRLVREWWGTLAWPLSLLVNNAGFGTFGAFEEADPKILQDLCQVDFSLPLVLTRQFEDCFVPPALLEVSGVPAFKVGVLNVVSTAAFQPGPQMAAYFGAKAGLLSWSRALAWEWKSKGRQVLALCPGPTSTDFGRVAGVHVRRSQGAGGTELASKSLGSDAVVMEAMLAWDRGDVICIPGSSNRWGVRLARWVDALAPSYLTRIAAAVIQRSTHKTPVT